MDGPFIIAFPTTNPAGEFHAKYGNRGATLIPPILS
jgi:hypothetical protein